MIGRNKWNETLTFQVSLIVAGDRAKENLILPKYTSPVINKYIRPLCNPYLELVNAFYTNNMSELQVRLSKTLFN